MVPAPAAAARSIRSAVCKKIRKRGWNNSTNNAESYAGSAFDDGYGAMMCFNLRTRNDNDPLPLFQALSNGAYDGSVISCSNGNRARTAGSVASGYTITYAMAQ